jgi:hypothetical protein
MTAEERTGWRDQELSERHRLYGFDCPAVDVDFLLLEYDKGEPVALVDYKHHLAAEVNPQHPSMRATSILADRGQIPFFVVRYWTSPWAYAVQPMNGHANELIQDQTDMSEVGYVNFLYHLRDRVAPAHVTDRLDTHLPPSPATEMAWL